MEREELQKIRNKATESAKHTESLEWIYAYTQLAMAADYLDAMIARTEIKGDFAHGL